MAYDDSKPVIPMEEYPLRWARARELMASCSLDLLVAYADDHAVFGPAWARYFANFTVHFEPCIILLPLEGEPVLLVGPECPTYAALHSPVRDIRVLKEFTHPDEDYPFAKLYPFREILDSLNLKNINKIGVCGKHLMSYDLFSELTVSSKAQWTDVESLFLTLRYIKSNAEIAVIRYAYQIAEKGLLAAIDAVKPGISEREIAAEAEYVMRKMGAEGLGIDTFAASGKNAGPIIARTTFRKIEKDDFIFFTIAPRYEGYHGAVGVPVILGKVNEDIRKACCAAKEAHELCASALKAGMDCKAEQMGRDHMGKFNLDKHFLYSGIHSIGVIEFEAPIFGPSCREKMDKNMILSIDIPVFDAPWGGLRIENGYLITESGAESLANFPFVAEK